MSAFSYFDKDGSGYITIDEIQEACKEFGLDDIHIDDMVKEIDQDNVSILLSCNYELACIGHLLLQLIFLDYKPLLALFCLSLKNYGPVGCGNGFYVVSFWCSHYSLSHWMKIGRYDSENKFYM